MIGLTLERYSTVISIEYMSRELAITVGYDNSCVRISTLKKMSVDNGPLIEALTNIWDANMVMDRHA